MLKQTEPAQTPRGRRLVGALASAVDVAAGHVSLPTVFRGDRSGRATVATRLPRIQVGPGVDLAASHPPDASSSGPGQAEVQVRPAPSGVTRVPHRSEQRARGHPLSSPYAQAAQVGAVVADAVITDDREGQPTAVGATVGAGPPAIDRRHLIHSTRRRRHDPATARSEDVRGRVVVVAVRVADRAPRHGETTNRRGTPLSDGPC